MVPESFPKSYNYPNEEENDHHTHSHHIPHHSNNEIDVMRHITDDIKPKIMIMGPKRFVVASYFNQESITNNYPCVEAENHPYRRSFSTKCHQMRHFSWRVQIRSSKMVIKRENQTLILTYSLLHNIDITNNSFISFSIWDFPGQLDDRELEFDNNSSCGALVFVIDSQVCF